MNFNFLKLERNKLVNSCESLFSAQILTTGDERVTTGKHFHVIFSTKTENEKRR